MVRRLFTVGWTISFSDTEARKFWKVRISTRCVVAGMLSGRFLPDVRRGDPVETKVLALLRPGARHTNREA